MYRFDQLTPAERERLTILQEEMNEAGQAICKILRHGYEAYYPGMVSKISNREHLEKEIGHIANALGMMLEAGDVDDTNIATSARDKKQSIRQWLRHQ